MAATPTSRPGRKRPTSTAPAVRADGDSTPFGAALAGHFQARAWTLREAARQLGVTHGFLSHLRSGRRPPPLAAMPAWADALGLDGDERELFLDLAALACTPDRIVGLLATGHPRLALIQGWLETGIVPVRSGRRAAEEPSSYAVHPSPDVGPAKRNRPG